MNGVKNTSAVLKIFFLFLEPQLLASDDLIALLVSQHKIYKLLIILYAEIL